MIENIQLSLLVSLKIKNPTVQDDRFFKDPPRGKYERPCVYLSFKEKVPAKRQPVFGSRTFDYSFDVTYENMEDTTAPAERITKIDNLYYSGEEIIFYGFVGTQKHERWGVLTVKSFRILESAKDREKNRVRAEMVITF